MFRLTHPYGLNKNNIEARSLTEQERDGLDQLSFECPVRMPENPFQSA